MDDIGKSEEAFSIVCKIAAHILNLRDGDGHLQRGGRQGIVHV